MSNLFYVKDVTGRLVPAQFLTNNTGFLGFLARPLGALVFGHFSDRIGRKRTLVATLLLMGATTFLIGLVPTYATIEIWGAVALTVLRMVQGFGFGGNGVARSPRPPSGRSSPGAEGSSEAGRNSARRSACCSPSPC